MRHYVPVACALLSCGAFECSADDLARAEHRAESVGPSIAAVLREASALTLTQDNGQRYWTDQMLRGIGELQIRAGDLDGALKSIRAIRGRSDRDEMLQILAEALARSGARERAFEILRESGSAWSDRVQLCWIERLVAAGDLEHAREAVGLLKAERQRVDGLRMLAVGYARSGDAAHAAECFNLTIDAAGQADGDRDRARALWETAAAQFDVGAIDAGRATIRRLIQLARWMSAEKKAEALRGAAVVVAKANDPAAARELFRRATEAGQQLELSSRVRLMSGIATDQAGVGLVEDAMRTVRRSSPGAANLFDDFYRSIALYYVTVAQLKAGDVDGAISTALSAELSSQLEDDACHRIVEYQVARRELKAALGTARRIDNPSRKAAAMLKVAAAHARAGDRATAEGVAAQIELRYKDLPFVVRGRERFHFGRPQTWGEMYDSSSAFTMMSHRFSINRAVEVASAAMALSQALGERPGVSYAVLFNDIDDAVIRALARAHATTGSPDQALAWARQIGSGGNSDPTSDECAGAVERRIHALIGVAEGRLDRASGRQPARVSWEFSD